MASVNWQQRANRIAHEEGVRPELLRALVKQESGWNHRARSPAGALGFTQLMPGTAAGLGVDALDPEQNLRGGARYLRQQLDAFGGDERLALAAYNAGPGAVQKYGGVPPYKETQHYVQTILADAGHGGGAVSAERGQATVGRGAGLLGAQGGQGAPQGSRYGAAMQLLHGETSLLGFARQVAAADQSSGGVATAPAPAGPERAQPHLSAKGLDGVVAEAERIARRAGLPVTSGLRTVGSNAAAGGAPHSDHIVGDGIPSNARDFGVRDPQKGEQVAASLAQRFGLKRQPGTLTEGVVTIGRRKAKVQIIYGTGDHMDHVHFGLHWLS